MQWLEELVIRVVHSNEEFKMNIFYYPKLM